MTRILKGGNKTCSNLTPHSTNEMQKQEAITCIPVNKSVMSQKQWYLGHAYYYQSNKAANFILALPSLRKE